ncbi:hypothetical protein ACJMK2_039736 [Sinanodonta woodiana]|uniref:DOMON domain-containing protein n=1 Tax=Sinanodonta woodiana TaxID=1069815 RepID=A0ABD3WEX2_SINWO
MSRSLLITFFTLLFVTVTSGQIRITNTENFNYSAQMDNNGNYLLFWKFNDTHITFEVHVKTYGYVGFGLSDNGNMYPADVVVGWVKNGIAHLKDYHTTMHAAPVVDKQQDWFLIRGEETDFGTVLEFVRKLDTCDKAEDKKIDDGTIRLIYSYHPSDPASESLMYHGPEHRGTKSLSLLSVSSAASLSRYSADHGNIQMYDFLNGNFLIPTANTFYRCRGFRMPNIGGKRHLIKVEPIITPGNEKHVHHILIYRCKGIDPKFDGISYNCYDEIPKEMNPCYDVIIAWAIGGKSFYYPEHLGVSVGAPDDPDFYIMETHYDNPLQKSGMIDDSGMRMTMTKNLRPNEADIMVLGHVENWSQITPPFESAFFTRGYCPSQCIDHALQNLTEIKVFGIFQHAHLLGRAITTRRFQNGTELPPLATDPGYDFNFQEIRLLKNEIAIKHGESFMVECTYDSTARTTPTLGGPSTRDEMCLSYLLYYPKVELKYCQSSPSYDSISNDQTYIRSLIHTYNWTSPDTRETFKRKLHESSIIHYCRGDHMVPTILSYVHCITIYTPCSMSPIQCIY